MCTTLVQASNVALLCQTEWEASSVKSSCSNPYRHCGCIPQSLRCRGLDLRGHVVDAPAVKRIDHSRPKRRV